MSDAVTPDPLVIRYLDHVRFEKRLAERTCALYQLDLIRLADMAAAVAGARATYLDAARRRDRVIEMLTSDTRLMAAARSRAFCGPADDPWIRYVGEVVSLADARSAQQAMAAVFL